MLRPEAWVVLDSETCELDQMLSQWNSMPGPTGWTATVQIQSDDIPELFRMCWHTKFPHGDDSPIRGGIMSGTMLAAGELEFGGKPCRST